MTSESSGVAILYIGVSDIVHDHINARLRVVTSHRVSSADDFLALAEDFPLGKFQIAIAGPQLNDISTIEIAQSIRGAQPDLPLYFCHHSRDGGFDRKDFVKNGFEDAFILPFDDSVLAQSLESAAASALKQPSYRRVRVVDIVPGEPMGFDIYILLPMNGRYVRYSAAGNLLDENRVAKLRNHEVKSVHVPVEHMQEFYKYTANRLRKLANDAESMSETERREKQREAIRAIVSNILSTNESVDYATGRQILEDAGEIVKAYVSAQSNLYAQLLEVLGDSEGTYSHLSNVSTFAALFSLASGIGKPEELALAGLFHDLGMSELPYELQIKPPSQLTPEERAIYYTHPEKSVNLLKSKKVVLSPTLQTIILQHHERLDGKGFPEGLAHEKIRPESQLLAIADEFGELTHSEIGHPGLPAEAALKVLAERGGFNGAILMSLMKVFRHDESELAKTGS
ncbi:MAG: HD domain-containing phosphohydrolase [Bdellovibrionales bacterium]|jgi:HD-GYP domain-containing protein (c-di-GMP phosphodiesterase class II)|nr:HD domain-containing phosphohydrolase [Bdellovibrionales bacterium]